MYEMLIVTLVFHSSHPSSPSPPTFSPPPNSPSSFAQRLGLRPSSGQSRPFVSLYPPAKATHLLLNGAFQLPCTCARACTHRHTRGHRQTSSWVGCSPEVNRAPLPPWRYLPPHTFAPPTLRLLLLLSFKQTSCCPSGRKSERSYQVCYFFPPAAPRLLSFNKTTLSLLLPD